MLNSPDLKKKFEKLMFSYDSYHDGGAVCQLRPSGIDWHAAPHVCVSSSVHTLVHAHTLAHAPCVG